MAKLVCLTLPYAQFPVERAIEGIARAGYTYVGIGWPHQGEDPIGSDPDGGPVRRFLDLCRAGGLTPVVVGGGISPSDRLQKLKGRIDVAKAIGAEVVQTAGAGGYRRFPNQPLEPPAFEEAHRAFLADMKEAGPYAERMGVVVALKPHTGNTATARHLAALLPEIDCSAVQACYDPGNVHFYEGISPEEDFPLIAERTYEIVAKDHRGPRAEPDFPLPGEGDVDFARIFAAAGQAGFDGPVVVERVNGTGGTFTPEEIDGRILQARENLEGLLGEAGLELEG